MSRVLSVLLVHHSPEINLQRVQWWRDLGFESDLLLVHGGTRVDFEATEYEPKVFAEDPCLRTINHPLERQSYTGVFQLVGAWSEHREFTHVYFSEFDHLPLRRDLYTVLLAMMEAENADVLAYHLKRVDRTSDPHYLYECSEAGFGHWLQRISRRENKDVVLSLIATGSFWKMEAFRAVCAQERFPRIYLEMFLPTLAHHLGFRLRDMGEQNEFITVGGPEIDIADASRRGALAVHPIKEITSRHFATMHAPGGKEVEPLVR